MEKQWGETGKHCTTENFIIILFLSYDWNFTICLACTAGVPIALSNPQLSPTLETDYDISAESL